MTEGKPRREPQAVPQRTRLAEYERQDWCHNAETGTTLEDIQSDSYWALMAADFKPYARIEVRIDTGEWLAELLVLQCERTWAKVHLLKSYELTKVEDFPVSMRHRVEWKGPQRKWSVIRTSDQQPVRDKFESRSEGNDWLAGYERASEPALAR